MTTPAQNRRPRIVFTCGREPDYIRNRLLIRGLDRLYPLSVVASRRADYPGRLAATLPRLVTAARDADLIVTGFLGQPYALLAARLLRKPVLLDAFVSVYDTLCLDRRTVARRGALGRLLFEFDRVSFNSASVILVDSEAQRQFFSATFGVPRQRFEVHYLGPDFQALVNASQLADTPVNVLHYGSYLPLHGTDVIVRAASLLRDDPTIQFRLVGLGPRYAAVRALATELRLPSLEFVDWLPTAELSREIARATIGLGGHFADNPKARRVIAGKTFQLLAAGRPTIVGDCPANRELFGAGEHVEMVPLADPRALAHAIADLARDARRRHELGVAGSQLMWSLFAEEQVAQNLRLAVEKALANRPNP
jgi:glycosyltransferase involved in cell wall biosynthesis